MPQMAPISWLGLFFAFSLILLIFNCINYYSFPPQTPQSQEKSIFQSPMNWKW